MLTWQPGITLEDVEKETIVHALRFYNNNKTHTAGALGVSIRTLYNKLNVYKLSEEEAPEDDIVENKKTKSNKSRSKRY